MADFRVGSTTRTGATLHVRLLGDVELHRGDGPALALPPSRRTRALLGYLVATGTAHSRSALCDLLWDGTDDPRASLRWSLTKLRPLVDGDGGTPRLRADRDKVGFVGERCHVDSLQVDALLQGWPHLELPLDTLEDAARRLQGEFLEGLELPACYRFHHWWMAERERFARCRRGVLEALVARLADAPERALPYGRAMVASDPLAEPAHATLVRLLAAAGRYPEAEQHYAYARALLRREIALPDGGDLDQTIRAVRRHQRQAAAAPPASAPASAPPGGAARTAPGPRIADLARPAATGRAVLVGRAAESEAIEAALAQPTNASVLLLLGEPGIGKTRLLEHAADRARARGFGLIGARCFEAEAVRPYGFWIDALRAVPTEDIDERVRAAVAPLRGGRVGALSRDELFDATALLLDGLAAQRPQLVVVDDLQWIDEASAALLHYVTRRLGDATRPVVFVAAARAGEVDDNAGARSLLQSLARVRPLSRLEPQPLAEPEVRRWLGNQLPDVAAALRDSGGNPLYLVELARVHDGGRPRGNAGDRQALETLIGARLQTLDEAARDLLGWAATLAGSFGAERLADITAMPLTDVLPRIALLERRGLLRADAEGGLDFAHGLVRQAVYRSLSMVRRRAQHRQIARTLLAASADDPWLHGEVVHHACLAGDTPVAARAALAAGEHWLRVFANRDAAQVAERGLALLDGLAAGAPRTRLEVGLLRLRVAAAAAPGGRGLPDLRVRIRHAVDAALAQGQHGVASSGWEILAYWCQQTGDALGAQEATLAAERCARLADSFTRCQQLANTGRCLIDIEADGERGRALLANAEALAAELQLPLMELEWGRGLVARADGDLAGARGALERAVALARAASNHWREYECMLALATVEYELGRFDDVLRHVDEVADAARRMGEPQVPFADALAALARQRLGDASADAAVQASLAALRERDAKAHLAYALNEAAARALGNGLPAAASQLAAEALGAAQAVRRPTLIARARATLAAAAPAPAVHSRPARATP
jgi:DNA-binding SARP family transcriptional activator/nucleoside-triphosphatase THEP1